jgi:Colicin immunity protein / pyocin immunity protein
MGSYSTVHINITFREDTPSYVTDFFHQGIKDERLPTFLYNCGFTFDNRINLIVPEMMLCEFGAKTYIDNVPNNRFFLNVLQEFEMDRFSELYALIATLAGYSENTNLAGYIKHEFGSIDLFAFEDGLVYWKQEIQIEIDRVKKYGKLDFYELCVIGAKIKNSEGTEAEINKMMEDFDRSVPHPKGSNLFFYPENYDARNDDIASYNPSVEEVVQKCLDYKPINL